MSREIIQTDSGEIYMVDTDGFEFDAAVADPPAETSKDDPVDETAPENAGTQPSQRTTSTKPQEASWDEWQRRSDAVRTLAREFDEVDHGDIREFLQGKTARELTDEEVGQIRHDIVSQRISDIADILDEQLRSGSERFKRARRTVRVQAPRGWLRRAFNTLDERAVGQVAARLIQRGHDPDTIKEKVVDRVRDEEAQQRIKDAIDNEELKIEFAGGLVQPPSVLFQEPMTARDAMDFATDMAERIAANIRIPEVRVEVPVNVGGNKKRVVRGENGLIEEVIEEPDAS